MFKIDLLKGRGLPVKSDIETATVVGIAFSIPIILLILMTGSFLYNGIIIKTQTHTLENYETKFIGLKQKLIQEQEQRIERSKLTACLTETEVVLDNYIQWTDLLVLLGQSLPESMIIDNLEIKVISIQKKVVKRSDPTSKINISVPSRTLLINMYSLSDSNSDQAVMEFQESLQASTWFRNHVEDIVIASREPDEKDGRDIIRYEISCAFAVNLM